jgi:hypothetical protein
MPYSLKSSQPNHKKAKFIGFIKINNLVINIHWQPEIDTVYGVEALSYQTGKNHDLIVYPTYQILEKLLQADKDDIIVILPQVLAIWERYRPDEVEALAQVPYLTAEPPRGFTRLRRVSSSKPPTPEASLAHRIKMLESFIDDLEKKGLKWRDMKYARATLAKLQTMLEDLLRQSQNAR